MALQHANSGVVMDLNAPSAEPGRVQTRALVKQGSFEAIQLSIRAGNEIPRHQVAGKFTLSCIEGRVIIHLDSEDVEVSTGQWVFFDGGVQHSVEAVEDSSLLLTIIFGPDLGLTT